MAIMRWHPLHGLDSYKRETAIVPFPRSKLPFLKPYLRKPLAQNFFPDLYIPFPILKVHLPTTPNDLSPQTPRRLRAPHRPNPRNPVSDCARPSLPVLRRPPGALLYDGFAGGRGGGGKRLQSPHRGAGGRQGCEDEGYRGLFRASGDANGAEGNADARCGSAIAL